MNRRHVRGATITAVAFGAVLVANIVFAQDATRSTGTGQPATLETLSLTLDDAVRRAVDHNPELAIVRLGTESGAARVAESRGAFAPVFSTLFGRSSNATPPSNFLTGDRGVDVNDLFSSTGVRQRVPWGAGTWSISWDAARTTTDNPISSFDPALQSGVQLAFSQPLFRDRKIDAARQQYIIAKRDQQISELRFRESVVQTVAAVKQAYWTFKASMANVTVQQRSLELAQELARENKVRVEAGQNPPLDLVQAQAEVAQRRENVIRANATGEEAEDRLRRLIMDPSDSSFWQVRIDPVEEPSGHDALPDVNAAVSNALKQRSDLARASQDLEKAQTNVEFLGNQKLPDVRLETSYRGSGLGGTQFLRTGGFPGVVTGTRDRSLGAALGQAFSPEYPTWSVGVSVSYPLGTSYEEASFARAQIERRQAEHRISSLQLQTAETVRQAARQVRSTAERIDAARAGSTLAQERFDAEQRRYEVGLSTTFLVTQAQRDLLQAQVNVLQTMLDYESSLVNFETVQQAPPGGDDGGTLALQGSAIVLLPTATPRGVFRPGAGSGF